MQLLEEYMEKMRKHRDIKLVTTEATKTYLASESNYHTTHFFSKNLLALEMRKTQILMNKPVYLNLSIFQLSKIVIYQFLYVYHNIEKRHNFVTWIHTDSLYT